MASEKEKQQNRSKARNEKDDEKKRQASNEKRAGGQSSKDNKNQARGEKRSSGESKLEAGKSGKTTNHDTIRRWVEERGGVPSTVRRTGDKNDPGLLRIDFPGRSNRSRGRDDQTLEEISWDEFFEKFDEKELAFLYQEETKTGRTSRFSKFVNRERSKRQPERND